MNDRNLFISVLLACVVLTGCATSRSEVQLGAPTAVTPAVPSKNRNVVIRTVTDARNFEEAPSDPSIPSLGHEGSAAASAELKARAIARKRNTFGKALGDVTLQEGQTVAGVVRSNLAIAFQQAGFTVTPEGAAGDSPLVVDVSIKQFWGWMTPGFWALTFETKIETDLDFRSAATPLTIKAYAQDSGQLGTDSAYIGIVSKALDAYRSEATMRLQAIR